MFFNKKKSAHEQALRHLSDVRDHWRQVAKVKGTTPELVFVDYRLPPSHFPTITGKEIKLSNYNDVAKLHYLLLRLQSASVVARIKVCFFVPADEKTSLVGSASVSVQLIDTSSEPVRIPSDILSDHDIEAFLHGFTIGARRRAQARKTFNPLIY